MNKPPSKHRNRPPIPHVPSHPHPDLEQLIGMNYHNPHAILGFHDTPHGHKMIRLWRPGAHEVFLEVFGEIVKAVKVNEAGLFEYPVPSETMANDYRIYHNSGLLAHDPYAILPTFGELDLHLFSKGEHYQLYRALGGRLAMQQGISGVKFAVWAPWALRVSLLGDFNQWDPQANPMRNLGHPGIWEIFIPGIGEGEKYKFEIKTQKGHLFLKSDPMAYSSELRSATASVIAEVERFTWEDEEWISRRIHNRSQPYPMSVYEVHLGSWKKGEHGRMLNYREIAKELAAYCLDMGFTHVELLPLQEHPLDESWGYQVSGFYAVTSRFGTPEDFQWFVNYMHLKGIGVILDWVPGHFPSDLFSLGRFDGTCLYEHEDPRQGLHPHWGTYIFNFGRKEVSNFLIANALYWFDLMHIDGLRVDAVASMLYLDYGRNHGEWIPNKYGHKENLEAVEFFQHLNAIVHRHFPGIQMIAEESTSFPRVTHAVEEGGLGFDMKWNMGWMNDTLRYFQKEMHHRHYHHNHLTFGLLYAFSEKFILVLSHDEVVHGKRSLISKMPGETWQKFANLRLMLSYMMCQPGKKLLFMGGEIGQWSEWNCKGEVEWGLLGHDANKGIQRMVRELNHFYRANSPMWEHDFDPSGFKWVDFCDVKNSVISYLRQGSGGAFLCIHNFSSNSIPHYHLSLEHVEFIEEVFNTDNKKYGGSGQMNPSIAIHRNHHGQAKEISFGLPPLTTMIFRCNRKND